MSAAPPARSRAEPGTAAGAVVVVGLAMLAVGVAQGFGRFTYALVLPALGREILPSWSIAGLLGTANVGAYLGGTLAVSVAATRHEPRHLILFGLALSTTGLTILAAAPGLLVLFAGMVLTGFGGAFIWIPAPGIAGAAVDPDRRGLAIGLLGTGIGLSIVFASQLAAAVRHFAGDGAWRAIWGIEAGIAAATLAAVVVWLRPRIEPVAGGTVRLSALRSVPGWRGLVTAYAAYGLSYSLYMNYLVAALEEDAGFTPAHASGVYAIVGVAIVFGGVLLGRISDRVGRRPTMICGYAIKAACAALVILGAEPWAAISAFFFGLVMAGLGAVTAAHVADHVEPRSFGTAFGTVTLCFGVAQLVGPQLGGWLADVTGSFTAAFVVSSLVAAFGAAASATLPREATHPAADRERFVSPVPPAA